MRKMRVRSEERLKELDVNQEGKESGGKTKKIVLGF